MQSILTEYGCIIKTRLGLHHAAEDNDACSEMGLIILEFISNVDTVVAEMAEKLSNIPEVLIQQMKF